MGFRGMFGFGLTWVLLLLLHVTPSVESQMLGCSLQGIDLGQCLADQDKLSISSSCCKVLNQAVETGFFCLCLLLAASSPLLSSSPSMIFSNCYMSVPPLTQCRAPLPEIDPPASPVPPGLLPPATPVPAVLLPPSIPVPTHPEENQIPLAPPSLDDGPSIASPECPNCSSDPDTNVFNATENVASKCEDNTGKLLHPGFLLVLIFLHVFLL